MALPTKSSGTGRALGGGATKAPNPFRVWLGATIARACLFCALPPSAMTVVPDSATTRLSISTNEPDNGRSDHRVSPVTWTVAETGRKVDWLNPLSVTVNGFSHCV